MGNAWSRWVQAPQSVRLRKVLFQVHLWTGIGLGAYVFVICVTGSVLVYRNELYIAFSPQPVILDGAGASLGEDALERAARQAYPGHEVQEVRPGETPNHAVRITLARDGDRIRRLFDPFTGEDLGDPLPLGYRITAWTLDLHDNLLGGTTGRRVNGIGAVNLLVLSLTGVVIWWPGILRWRRSLTIDRRTDWNRFNWHVHSAFGFWCWPFLFLWAITGGLSVVPGPVHGGGRLPGAVRSDQPGGARRRPGDVLARVPALRPARRPGHPGLRGRSATRPRRRSGR